jgi:hypothetical protein
VQQSVCGATPDRRCALHRTAGGAQEAYRLDALVAEVGERTAEASLQATRVTGEAIQKAADTIESSTAAVRTTITEIGAVARQSFASRRTSTPRASALRRAHPVARR